MVIIGDYCLDSTLNVEEMTRSISDDKTYSIKIRRAIRINLYSNLINLANLDDDTTYINLGECENYIKEYYNLDESEKLYIMTLDMNKRSVKSSVNNCEYEIYLPNGTLVENADELCGNNSITMYSPIADKEIIKYDIANTFKVTFDYDIYNSQSEFYQDYCSLAYINENDIIIDDRITDFYIKDVNFCNEGCVYNGTDFETDRTICKCTKNSDEIEEREDLTVEEDDGNFFQYLVDKINYKVFTCSKLIKKIKKFISYNYGLYVSGGCLLISIINIIIFSGRARKKIKNQFFPEESAIKINNKSNEDNVFDKKYLEFPKDEKNNIEVFNVNKENGKKENEKVNKVEENKIENNNIEDNKTENYKIEDNNKEDNKSENYKIENNKIEDNITENYKIEDNNNIENNIKKNYKIENNNNIEDDKIEDNIEFVNGIEPLTLNINKEKTKNEYLEKIAAPPPKNGENQKEGENVDTVVFEDINLDKKINNEYNLVDNIFANRPKKKKRNIKNIPKNSAGDSMINSGDKSKTENRSTKELQSKDNTTLRKLLQEKNQKRNISNKKINDVNQNNNEINKQEYLEKRFPLNNLIANREDTDSDYNDLPYTKALRIDKRNFFVVFFLVFFNKIDIVQIIFFRDEFEFLPISVNIFILDELLELFFNALLYNDDVISQKYHSNGKLDFITEQLLSLASNLISYLIMRVFSKLVVYNEYFSLIEKEIKGKEKLTKAVDLGLRVMKKAMTIFSVINITILLIIFYYLSIFCAMYPKSQASFFKDFGLGELQSLILSFAVAILVATFRKISLKCRIQKLYETSKFIDNAL